ncbi:transcription elongation factor Spt5 [Candidatus Pacearchaeota archaeon]|nr:MAG: transcription elongation factor Spt5 [Candidatus Pacearchaeota archaeon]
MAIGFEDEFDYLEEESEPKESFAPKIKGTKDSKELSLEEPKVEEEERKKEPEKEFNSSIFVVKVTTNKEDRAFEMIADKILKKGIKIYSLARPHGLRGYILIEAPDREHAEEAVFNLPYVKGILPKVVTYKEVKPSLEPVATDMKIEKGDIVEMISEPFKNEKAKVVRVDKVKGECIVSLLEAAVQIPVTVKLDNVRVIRREEGDS